MKKFDIESLTLNEVEIIEDMTGKSIEAIGDVTAPKGAVLKAMVFVVMRRDNPDVTADEAGDMPMTEVMGLFGADDDEDDAAGND